METDNSGTVQAIYNYGYGLISRTGVLGLGSEVLYYNYDGIGSTRQLTDSSGAVTVSYMYDSFGNLIASSGTSDNTYGFTGQQQFNEADNLVFLRARYYNTSIGRFISRDPIGYRAGLNLYAYVRNNPINSIDPSGKISTPCEYLCTGIAAAATAACLSAIGESCIGVGICAVYGLAVYDSCLETCNNFEITPIPMPIWPEPGFP